MEDKLGNYYIKGQNGPFILEIWIFNIFLFFQWYINTSLYM